MAVTSSRSRFEVRVVDTNGKPIDNASVSARQRPGEDGVAFGYDARARAWTPPDPGLGVGSWLLQVEARPVEHEAPPLESQERMVSVSERGLQALFILGQAGLPFYYRGGAKVPFMPLGLVAASVRAGEESNAAALQSVAVELGLKPARLPEQRKRQVPDEKAEEIRRRLLGADFNGARSDALSPRNTKPTDVWVFEVPGGPRQSEQFEQQARKLPYIRHVGPVVHRSLDGERFSFLTNQMVVAFRHGVGADDVEAAARVRNLRVKRQIKYAGNAYLLESVTATSVELLETCNRWVEHPDVRWAEPNLVSTPALHFTPDDFGGQLHHPIINSEGAWDFVRANQVHTPLIAVIDEGCDVTHPDFVGNLNQFFNFSTLTTAMFPSPHGTMTAGVAAAVYNNNLGIAGVAGMCQFMAIQLPQGEDLEYADMFVWCAGMDTGNPDLPAPPNPGADVLSNSWGLGQDRPLPTVVSLALDEVTANGRKRKGCVVVFASGNDDDDFMVKQPWAAHPDVIAVGSSTVDGSDMRAAGSNFGSQLSVCAPGGDLYGATLSTTASAVPQGRTSGAYAVVGQTSCACAQVAGVAALMLAVKPDLSAVSVKDILQQTAIKIDALQADPVGAYDADGHSQWYGFGRVDANAAVR